MMKKMITAASALVLTACGNINETADQIRSKVDTAVDEQKLGEAVSSAVDLKALDDVVGATLSTAVDEAIGEVLPTRELAAVGAVIDGEALARGLDEAIDQYALQKAIDGSAEGAAAKPAK